MRILFKKCKTLTRLFLILIHHGFPAFKKSIDRIRYRKSPSLEQLQSIHRVDESVLDDQRNQSFDSSILFSILTPLYNTPEKFLIELLESVKKQTYPYWQFCLADASQEGYEYVERICKEYASTDSRFVYFRLENNEGISGNTNACLKLATGNYIGLLDHDDILHPSALYECYQVIKEQNADFMYTDEVKFDTTPELVSDPLFFNFKPGFGKEDLRSHNYICHFTCFKKSLLDVIGDVYRPAFDGSQDHDMVLRLTEVAKHIVHIPKVLYYWRVHKNSVSMDLSTKSYAVDAAIHAIEEQLEREHEKGTVSSNLPFLTIYREKYEFPKAMVSILIHSIDSEFLFEKTKRSIEQDSSYTNIEILRADDLEKAIQSSKGDYILFVKSGCIVKEASWIEELLMHAFRTGVGTVAGKVYNSDTSIHYAGVALRSDIYPLCKYDLLSDIGYEGMLCYVRNVSANRMVCMMTKKKDIQLDLSMKSFIDIDLCLMQSQKGLRHIWTPFALMEFTGKSKEDNNGFLDLQTKWKDTLNQDPYFNSNWETLHLV